MSDETLIVHAAASIIDAKAALPKEIQWMPPGTTPVQPMGVERYGEHFIKRKDPKGRTYYWATNDPPPRPGETETDLTAIGRGFVTLTPLQYDMTRLPVLLQMQSWNLQLPS